MHMSSFLCCKLKYRLLLFDSLANGKTNMLAETCVVICNICILLNQIGNLQEYL